MRYAALVLLAGCMGGGSVAEGRGGGDVDGLEREGARVAFFATGGFLGGVAGLEVDGAGGGMDAAARMGGAGGNGGSGGTEGPDSGTTGTGGSEGPAALVGGDYGDPCMEHDDCADRPEGSGFCWEWTCIDLRDWTPVADGADCANGMSYCVGAPRYECMADDRGRQSCLAP